MASHQNLNHSGIITLQTSLRFQFSTPLFRHHSRTQRYETDAICSRLSDLFAIVDHPMAAWLCRRPREKARLPSDGWCRRATCTSTRTCWAAAKPGVVSSMGHMACTQNANTANAAQGSKFADSDAGGVPDGWMMLCRRLGADVPFFFCDPTYFVLWRRKFLTRRYSLGLGGKESRFVWISPPRIHPKIPNSSRNSLAAENQHSPSNVSGCKSQGTQRHCSICEKLKFEECQNAADGRVWAHSVNQLSLADPTHRLTAVFFPVLTE